MYRHLNSQYVAATLRTLKNRIYERFPESNLNNICQELLDIAAESSVRIEQIRRPRWVLRFGIALVVGAIIAITASAAIVVLKEVPLHFDHLAELLQGLDAGVNETVLLSIALVFLFTLENRIKRGQTLRALHDLRSIAHVIDMHQLSKDPESVLSPTMATASSPHRNMTRFQLSRYLDYCAEMLSLTSKLAALHVQYVRDPVVMSAVSDVETLASGLSQKIWQKISILDTEVAKEAIGSAAARGDAQTTPAPTDCEDT
jgi:hypothetical protein